MLGLLRNPKYCVYAASQMFNERTLSRGEDTFNRISMEERGKYKEETLVNYGGRQRSAPSRYAARRCTSLQVWQSAVGLVRDAQLLQGTVGAARCLRAQLAYVVASTLASRRSLAVQCRSSSDGVQELIVVTILLAAKGSLRVPAITNAVELKDALNKLGAVRSDQVRCPCSSAHLRGFTAW